MKSVTTRLFGQVIFSISAMLFSFASLQAAPVITSQPVSVTAAAGTTASFSVSATGTGTLTYRWRRNGGNIGVLTSNLVLNPVSDSQAGNYTVVVTDVSGSVTSAPPAVLTVIHPPVIINQPESLVVLDAGEASFGVDVNSPSDLSYQWKKSGVDVSGETSSVLNFFAVYVSDAGSYAVLVTNIDGAVTSSNAFLTVVETQIVQSVASPVNTCTNLTLSVVTHGTEPLHFQWYKGASPVGSDAPSYIILGITFSDADSYRVVVSNSGGSSAEIMTSITVQDPLPVIVGLPANIVTNTGAGNASCSQMVSWAVPSVTDNCAGATLMSNHNPGDTFPVGTTTVSYVATDSFSQKVTNSFTVTVTDTTPPVAMFHSISVRLDASGNYVLNAGDIAAIASGSSDPCGLALTNVAPSAFTFCDVGTPLVSLSLTDVHGNVTTTNATITVLAPTNVPSIVYVDSTYGACSGPVTFPNSGGSGSFFIGYNAFASIQSAINAVAVSGTVQVAAGTYNGALTANKAVTLLGANADVNGCGARSAESVVSVGVGGTAMSITADNVTLDGFALQGGAASTGVSAIGRTNVVVQNNFVTAGVAGLSLQNIAGPFTVKDNCVTLTARELNASQPAIGIILAGISGGGAKQVQNNNVSGALYGFLLADVNAASALKIQGGSISGVMQGVAVINYNLALSAQKSSGFIVDGISMSSFTGTSANAGRNFHAGVYVFTGGADMSAVVTGTLTNVTVTGTGKISADTAGFDFADFSTGSGVRQQMTVQNCNVSTNENRGVFISGANAVATVSGSSILGNGFDPYSLGGNHGFGVIARKNAQLTVTESFIANPAVQISDSVFALNADADTNPQGPTLIVNNCSIVNNGNGLLAAQSAGTLNASGNWWGTTDDVALTNLMLRVVDFTPYLGSGTDTSAASGFQGDFGSLYVTAFGAQTGAAGRVQEGIDSVATTGTVNVKEGLFVEQVEISKDVSLTGAGATTILRSPAILPLSFTESATIKPVVYVHNTANAIVQNLKVDGDAQGNANNRFAGVGYFEAGGTIANLVIQGARNNPFDGVQAGYGIRAYASTTPRLLTVTGCDISDFQKNGIDLRGASLTGTVTGNTITGVGGTTSIAQNGIVFLGASGLIENNFISGFDYTPADTEACGILVYQGAAVISGNTVTASEIGVGVVDPLPAMGLIANNNFAGNGFGIYNYSETSLVASNNWWGSISGPAGAINPYGTGSEVHGDVVIAPWLGDGTDTQPGIAGFQPNATPTYTPPTHLAFTTQPGGALVANPLAPQPVVTLLDAANNATPWANPSITLAISSNPTGFGVLNGTASQAANNGVATFTDVSISVAGGVGYTLAASDSTAALPSIVSSAFTVLNPVPAITSLNPYFALAGQPGFTLTVNGFNFVHGSVVEWNGAARPTTYVSSTQVTAIISAGDIASVGLVPITVENPAPGGGVSTPVDFEIHPSVPSVVYVDATYTGLPDNTPANWPYTGSGTNIIGYDAFATIQEGIDAVANSGTVKVAAGTYAEDLFVDKPMSLLGPNATNNPNTGVRVSEAVIVPFTSNPDINTGFSIIYIGTNQVTLKGFTLDGDNPTTTSGVVLRGADLDAVEALGDYEDASGWVVENNIIKNTSYAGIDLYNVDGAASGNNAIRNNKFSNIGYAPYGYGIAVLLYNNCYAEVSSNVMTDVRLGIQTGNFYSPNPGAPALIRGNNITSTKKGIFHNLAYTGASPFTISENIFAVQDEAGASRWDGVMLSSIQSSVTVTVSNNTIIATPVTQATVGYQVWNDPTTTGITIGGGSVSGAKYGVWLNNFDGYGPSNGDKTKLTVVGVTITGSQVAGVYVKDNTSSSHSNLQATVTGNCTITSAVNGSAGVLVEGAAANAVVKDNTASITSNAIGIDVNGGKALIQNNDLAGNTNAAIRLQNGGTVDSGNCSGVDLTGLGISTGGNNLSGYGFDNAAPWAILNLNSGGTPAVLAEHNNFGAIAGDNIRALFFDPNTAVVYSQLPQVIVAPAATNLICASDIPAGATNLSGFIAQGGYFSAGAASVSFSDSTNITGSGVIVRTYTVTDTCGGAANATQTITVSDTILPVISGCPANIITNTGPSRATCNQVVFWTAPTAGDNCALSSFISTAQPGDTFPVGTSTVTYTATDASGNIATCSFSVTVNDTTPPVVGTWPANRTLDVGGQCTVAVPNLTGDVVLSLENCGAVNITQSLAAGSFISLGVTNVIVTVTDASGNAVSNTVVLTVVDSNPAPLAAFVDDNYLGLPAGTVVKFPYGGAGADHYIGCDAFATIQAGINRVAVNGTVNVAAGTYVEDVLVNKPLNLVGPNGGINPNTGSRTAEAVIRPATIDTVYGIVVNVLTNQVAIKGFTVDGNNPALTSGILVDGIDVDASEAIASYVNIGSIVVANNIVLNTSYDGIGFYNDEAYSGDATSDNHIVANRLENIGHIPYGYGIGVIIYNNFYSEISSNVMTRVRIGVQTGNYSQANPGLVQSISDNQIDATEVGIFHNLQYQAANSFVISNNTINFAYEAGSFEWDGMLILSIQTSVGANIINNIVNGPTNVVEYLTAGYNIWNTPTTGNLAINGGSVSNANYGVWINNWDGYYSPGNSTKATINGLKISGASLAGIFVQDDTRAANGSLVSAIVTGNTAIHDSAIGILIQGTNASATVISNSASITGNRIGVSVDTGKALLQANDLTGNSIAAIWATNGAAVDAGNCSGANLTGLGISTGGNDLSGYLTGPAKAVINGNPGGMPKVLAEHNNFGATTLSHNIPGAFSGPVIYSQTPQIVIAPPATNYLCVSEVPAGATNLADFTAIGGYFSASSATVTYLDSIHPAGSGVITRTYTVGDDCLLSINCTQLITVSDTNPPVFTLVPNNLVLPADAGQCSKSNVTWSISAMDNCVAPIVVSIPSSGSTFSKGVTIVTNIATDASGNTTLATFTVTVIDTQAPLITVCANSATISADVTAHALIPSVTGQVTAGDNCGSVTLTQIPVAGTQVGLGAHTVTIYATDESSNAVSCMITITVVDTTAPAITCAPNATVTTLQAKDPYATGTPGTSDANGPVVLTYDDNRLGLTNCNTTGDILRTWTATDAANNVSTCVQTISVVDNAAPYFTYLPANITVTNDSGLCSAVVTYAPLAKDLGYFQGFEDASYVSGGFANNPSTDWNDYNSHVARAVSGAGGIISRNGISHAVIDSTVGAAAGDSTGAFTRLGGYSRVFGTGYRIAQDVYINLADPAVVNATATTGYAWDLSAASSSQDGGNVRDFIFHAAAYDANGVVIAADNSSSDSAINRGGDLRTGNHATLTSSGWYTFEWIFRNTNDVLAVDLNVRDTNGVVLFTQTLSNPADVISTIVGGHRYLWFTFIAADKLAIDNTTFERNVPVISSPLSGTAFPVGTTTVSNLIADACGNFTNASFTVTVLDLEAPVIQPIADIVTINTPGLCSAAVPFATLMATDNCAVASIVATPPSGSAFDVGTNLVMVVATDIHGNRSTNSFTVAVNDVEAPSANVPAAIVVANNPGVCGAVVNFTLPAQSDNCGIASATASPVSGSVFAVGITPVSVVVTDIHGNSSTNVFTVTVNDVQPPSANVPANIVQAVDAGQNYATVNFTLPAQSDNCGVSNQVAAPASGSTFPVGTNVVTVVVTDVHGNTSTNTFTVAVIALPAITSQPASRTNNAGTTATFTVVATSPATLTYQWFKGVTALSDIGNISGSASATLTIASVQDADVAGYSVQVSNLAGTVTSSTANLTVINPPVIASISPASQTNSATTTAVFAVSVTGTAPFNYQWSKITPTTTNLLSDTGNIFGATSNVLTITNVLAADQATYSVTVSNPAGTVTTNATLVVLDPFIFVQPVNVTNVPGSTVSFSVTAAGTATLRYQWLQNGSALPGRTGSILTLTNIADSDGGTYSVVVTNLAGSVTGSNATLTLKHPPVFTQQPTNLVVNLTSNAAFSVSVNGTIPFTYQWQKNGVDMPGETAKKLQINNAAASDAASYRVVVINPDGTNTSASATLTVIVPPAITSQPVSITNNAGSTVNFSVTNTGSPSTYRWYKNGVNLLVDGGNVSGATTTVLTISNLLGADSATYDVVISNAAGTVTSSNAILKVIDPIITSQPVSRTNNLGTATSFTVAVFGTSPQYQWLKNGSVIPGATSATYSIGTVADADAAAYSVIVSNLFGVVTSSAATLTVIDPVVITQQPLSRTNNAGTTATFNVAVTGTAPAYQWFKDGNALADGSNVSGSTSAILTLVNVQDADVAGYVVVVSNSINVVTSAPPATLTVIDAPVITQQPLSRTNNAGTTATFTVSATGTAPSYQWYKGGAVIGGATTATLTLANVQQSDATNYSVVLSNAAGTVTSSNATLTVIDAPVITQQPLSRTNNAGTTATFTVSATGTAPSYQWYKGGAVIGGATTATLTLANVQQSDATNYSVVLSNAAGTVTSSNATLTVIDAPVITQQPLSRTNNAGTTATFTVSATGTAPSYQWLKNGVVLGNGGNVSGATSATLTLGSVFGMDRADYSVIVSNAAAVVISSNATLSVIDPFIAAQPVGVTNINGSSVSFNVTAIGTAPLSYQWYQDGFIIVGETGSSLFLDDIADSDAGNYTVIITNIYGSVTSTPAILVTVPPLIVTQPANVVAVVGDPVNFSVSVNGATPFTYQWQKNGVDLPGENARVLSFNNVQTNNAASYRVLVTNPNGTQLSDSATLSVYTTVVPTMSILYSNDAAIVDVTGVPGYNYAIQGSTNLLNWIPLMTNGSPFNFSDTNTTQFRNRFYRGVYLPLP